MVKRIELTISKVVQMADKYMNKCLTSLAIKEMQMNTYLRFNLTSIRMALIKKTNNCCGCGEIGTIIHCWWQWELVQLLWKSITRFLKKAKDGSMV
jgi:hypothetical protein